MHDHDHHHHHHAPTEVRSQPVLLDLGDGIGALIVHTDPELLGVEVEISPDGADGNRQHKEVLQRTVGSTAVNVLVYDNLPEGEYTLWVDDVAWSRHVRIESGSVAELDWKGAGLGKGAGIESTAWPKSPPPTPKPSRPGTGSCSTASSPFVA